MEIQEMLYRKMINWRWSRRTAEKWRKDGLIDRRSRNAYDGAKKNRDGLKKLKKKMKMLMETTNTRSEWRKWEKIIGT